MPPRLSPSSLHAIQPLKLSTFPPSISPNLRTTLPRPILPRKCFRPVSQRRTRRPQYNQFENVQTVYNLWWTSPIFRYGVGVVGLGGGAFYFSNLEEVPISGRRRFNCISPAREAALAESQYREVMQEYGQYVLPPSHPHSELVNRVLGRLITAAGLEGQNWEVKVINDPDEANAFVLPGNKVFVFSGILPICAGEDGLAAVLGHELAHNIAHHVGEQLSRRGLLVIPAIILSFVFDISGQVSRFLVQLAFELPGSRKEESEADYIGLLLMAQACYNLSAAVGLWERMAAAEKLLSPQILSTHPASKKRMMVIQEWLPEAHQKKAESQCEITSGYMDQFAMAFSRGDEGFW